MGVLVLYELYKIQKMESRIFAFAIIENPKHQPHIKTFYSPSNIITPNYVANLISRFALKPNIILPYTYNNHKYTLYYANNTAYCVITDTKYHYNTALKCVRELMEPDPDCEELYNKFNNPNSA